MTQLSLSFLCLLSLWCTASATLEIKTYPLKHNQLALHLVSYEDSSTSQKFSATDVLLVHGLTYSSNQFDLNIKEYSLARFLVNQGFRVWLLGITGYGQSDKPKNGFIVTSDYAAQDINTAVDLIQRTTHSQKINLVGWSWGTVTTSRFVALYPEKINRLVLIAPILHGLGERSVKESYNAFTQTAAQSDFQRDTKGKIDFEIIEPDVLKAYLTQVKEYDGKGSPNGGRRDLFQAKNIELIPYRQLRVPVLLIAGDHDPYLSPRKDFPQMMKSLPLGSCSEIIKGAGHALFLEKPYYQHFQTMLASFLKSGCASLKNS
jgi:pimeloyl-ACP methyl ester carboxylesterase